MARGVLCGLIAGLVLCGSVLCGQTPDTLVILHTSDTHLVFDPAAYRPLLAESFTGHRLSPDSLARFFRTIPALERASAVVVTGDMLACFEGETPGGDMQGSQIERFRPLYDSCPVPLLLALGNHDISSYTTSPGDSGIITSQLDAERARASWIRNIPCFSDGTFYERTFPVGRLRYHFLFLDDGYSLHDGGRRLDKTQVDWLNDRVKRAGDEPVVIFHHIYFSLGDVNNDGIAFDKRKPVDWPGEKDCAEGFLRVLNEHPNVKALIVGHGHENVFEKIHFPGGHSIYQVETGSVTEGSANWRLLQFTGTSILVSKPGSRQTEVLIEIR